MSKGGKTQQVTQKTQLPAEQTRAINAITSEALGFLGQGGASSGGGFTGGFPGFAGPGGFSGFGGFGGGFSGFPAGNFAGGQGSDPIDIVPGLSDPSLAGIDLLQQSPDPRIGEMLGRTVGGEFLTSNPFTGMSGTAGVEDAITQAATRAVGDRFSQAGRTGSPAEGLTLGRTVARELAPFAFGAQESALNRGFRGFEAERGRQLGAINPLLNLPRQFSQDLLTAGGILEGQRERELREPLTRLGLVTDPLAAVIGGSPRTTTTDQPVNRNVGAGLLGGAATGAGLASALSLSNPLTAAFAGGGALLGGLL